MKILLGTNVMFYELGLLNEYCLSIRQALFRETIEPIDLDITIQFLLNTDTTFEYPENNDLEKFIEDASAIINGCLPPAEILALTDVLLDSELISVPCTMVNYRRYLNNQCGEYDVIVWGEIDCLLPRTCFENIYTIHSHAVATNRAKYIMTFSDRKMWDASWSELEHIDFKNKEYYERDNPKAFTELHSIRYTISQEELDAINEPYEESLQAKIINYPKFDGSLLIISADLIKSGGTIPLGFWGLSGEDEAMMYSCRQVMDNEYIQYIIANICKGHNREHPNKRIGAVSIAEKKLSTQRSKGEWYTIIRNMNKLNLQSLYAPGARQTRLLTYQDYFNKLNTAT